MAGHSKWKGIKHKKAVVDAQRGKVFTKLIRELTAAARLGGGSVDANSRLRLAAHKAREANLPKDTIEKAILRGTGDLPGVAYDEMVVEGYGPGGVAILVELLTDNKHRTSAEIRSLFTRYGASLAGAGSVSWLFQTKGLITQRVTTLDEEQLMDLVLAAGAEDLTMDGQQASILTSREALESVKHALTAHQVTWDSVELTRIPSSTVQVSDPEKAKTVLALLDALEEHEDTQHVWANFDIPDAVLAEHAGTT